MLFLNLLLWTYPFPSYNLPLSGTWRWLTMCSSPFILTQSMRIPWIFPYWQSPMIIFISASSCYDSLVSTILFSLDHYFFSLMTHPFLLIIQCYHTMTYSLSSWLLLHLMSSWWLILAYFTTIPYHSLAFSFAYFILHYESVLDTRNMVYKETLDRDLFLQASSPLALDPLSSILLSLYLCTSNTTG